MKIIFYDYCGFFVICLTWVKLIGADYVDMSYRLMGYLIINYFGS